VPKSRNAFDIFTPSGSIAFCRDIVGKVIVFKNASRRLFGKALRKEER
jgi:hypothetical protein